tara:strand:- start:899 stop:2533 length:1635 start_codon:yes stop_codon:yes gene_type:complete
MQKIPIVILKDIQETSKHVTFGMDKENHTYYFNDKKALNLKNNLGSTTEQDDFNYVLNKKNVNSLLNNKNNLSSNGGKLNISLIVGHNTIFNKTLGDLFKISVPHDKQNNNEFKKQISKNLQQEYNQWYNNVFQRYLQQELNGKTIEDDSIRKRNDSLNQLFGDKPLFEKLLLYIFYKRVNNHRRKQYYEAAHEKFISEEDKTKDFFRKLVNSIDVDATSNHSPINEGEGTNNISSSSSEEEEEKEPFVGGNRSVDLKVANGTVLLIYKNNQNLYVKLLFHGFPDKIGDYLDYHYNIAFSKLGKKLFNRVLKDNEGIIFTRHEHSFHNGLIKKTMFLDSPLTSLGIFKCMLVNKFLNEKLFYLPKISEVIFGSNLIKSKNGKVITKKIKKSLFDLIDIKQMIVSPLIRTHMTGLLIFGSKYVKHVYPEESLHVQTLKKCFLHRENENLEPIIVVNNISNRNSKTFKKRAYQFLNTKKNIIRENKTKKFIKKYKNPPPKGVIMPSEYQPQYVENEYFGGNKRKHRKTKRKLNKKKHKKTRRNKRT